MQPECNFPGEVFSPQRWLGQLGLLVIIGVAGCVDPPPPPPTPKPFAGITVRVAAPADPIVRQLLQRHGNAWSDRSGGKIEFVPAEASAADLRVFRPVEIPRLARDGRLVPLPDALHGRPGYDFISILGPYRLHLSPWEQKNYALPLLGDSLVCVYRADLLEQPQHRAALEARLHHALRPGGPGTWQEFAVIAEYFATTPSWDPAVPLTDGRRPSLPPLPDTPEELDRYFHAVAASFARPALKEDQLGPPLTDQQRRNFLYSYHFDVDTGAARLTDPGFSAAVNLLRQLQACRAAEPTLAPADAFRTGRAVLALVTLSEIHALRQIEQTPPIRLGVCRVPGSTVYYENNQRKNAGGADGNFVPYLGAGGWMGGLAPGSAASEAALDFLTYLTGPQVSLEVVYEAAWGGGPTRQSHLDLNNRSGWYNYGLSSVQTNQMLVALERAFNPICVNPVYRLRLPNQQLYEQALVEELRSVLQGGRPADAALADAARRWNNLGGADGKAKRLRDYRLSLGLN